MALHIARFHLESLRRHAESAWPNECCGLLVGRRSHGDVFVERVAAARNIAEHDRSRNYQIDWDTLFATIRQARTDSREIVGFYHSHPDGSSKPSGKDAAVAWLDRSYVIIPITEHGCRDPASWRIQNEGEGFEPEMIHVK